MALTPASPRLPNDPPRAAYVHVPFCRHRCGYCNFTLVAGRDDLIDHYLHALSLELGQLERRYDLDTLYFGGGTPSHLPPRDLQRLLELVAQHFTWSATAEVTFEANPLDVTPERLEMLRDFGVTRVSLGVQSFQSRKLQVLERDHLPADIALALRRCAATLPRVCLDLIFAAPGETLEEWNDDLRQALDSGATHMSTYGLTIEQGSAFYGRRLRGHIVPATDDLEATMYEQVIDTLTAHGWEHYEVSNFARPGQRSRHNCVYWRGESYFAFGPGAASYVRGRRSMNHKSTTTYIQRLRTGVSPVAEWEELTPRERARERLIFGLRMLEGVSPDEYLRDTGFSLHDVLGVETAWLFDHNYLRWSDSGRLSLTRRGLLISDSIFSRLLSQPLTNQDPSP